MQLIEGRHYRSELLAKLEVEHAQASPEIQRRRDKQSTNEMNH